MQAQHVDEIGAQLVVVAELPGHTAGELLRVWKHSRAVRQTEARTALFREGTQRRPGREVTVRNAGQSGVVGELGGRKSGVTVDDAAQAVRRNLVVVDAVAEAYDHLAVI